VGEVFRADFSSTRQWVAGRSSAYPNGGPTNPDDNKLDHLTADPDYSRDGVFQATRRDDGLWDAGLLTTEGSEDAFMVRTGDILEARLRLPDMTGAWPAIWAWRDGGNEIDMFEYHPDIPDNLELSNHIRDAHQDIRDPAIKPGAWIDLALLFGESTVQWSLNGKLAFDDKRGVGPDWSAYLIVNMSVCAGRYHPTPDPDTAQMSFEVASLTVHR
jgi:hypothetical protein